MATTAKDWLADYTSPTDLEDVRSFCISHNVMPQALQAIQLANQCFPHFKVRRRVVHDPESDEKWIRTTVSGSAPVAEFRKAYESYVNLWHAKTTRSQGRLFSLTYNLH